MSGKLDVVAPKHTVGSVVWSPKRLQWAAVAIKEVRWSVK